MNVLRVYYRDDGKIVGWDNCAVAQSINALQVIVAGDAAPDIKKQMVDPILRQLRDMTADEELRLNMPTRIDIMCMRPAELVATDWRESQPAWAAYRQALRDITLHDTAEAMIAAWPMRPDGSDALAQLRRFVMAT